MKMKMTLAAGALALAFAGQASAAIVTTAGFGNNLILSVWDATNSTSFTANLGTTMQSFMTGAGLTVTGTATAPVTTIADTAANNSSVSVAGLSTYLATASANTVWSVVAANTAVVSTNTYGILTTSTAASIPTFSVIPGSLGNLNGNYVAGVNGIMGAGTTATATSASGAAYVGFSGNGMGNNFGTLTPFTNTAAIGQSQNFFFLTPVKVGFSYSKVTGTQFTNANGASAWTLAANGTLSYAVAPVPEPGEWLLMLSGLALIGFIATRRKEGSVSFA